MRRSTGVAASQVVAGLQVIFGYFSVAPPVPPPVADGPFASASPAVPTLAPAHGPTDVGFAVRPPSIRNPLWLVFRGRRDPRTGCLEGEIVPDLPMRVLGLVPCTAFAVVGIGVTVATVVVPMTTGGQLELPALLWSTLAVAFAINWARSYGAAARSAALNVRRDSPGARVAWHPGLRWGSRSIAPSPPPRSSAAGWASLPYGAGPAAPALADEDAGRSRRAAWLSLVGLVVPISIVALLIVPTIRTWDDRSDWVRVDGVVGAQVDLDHRRVTYALPDGTEKTSTVSVMRTVEEGETVELYYPPERPDLIEQDDRGFMLPYFVFGGFAVLVTALIIRTFILGLRRSRRSPDAPS